MPTGQLTEQRLATKYYQMRFFCFVLFWFSLAFGFFETGFLYVKALAAVELALVDQADLDLTEICLCLPPRCWDLRRVPPLLG